MNAAVALLNDPSLRAQLADEDVEGLEPEDRALVVLRNSLRKRLRDIYTEMDRADHPLHWNRVDKLLRALERYLEATGEVGERWRDLDRAQDLTEPLVYLKRALGVPPIQRRRDPFMDYRLAWLKDRLLQPVPDRDLDRLRGALIRIKAMQESKDLARTGVAPDVDWKQGFMDAARAVYQQDEETNEFQYGINWDEGDQVRLVGEVMYFALHKLELLDVDHNPLAALGRGDEDQVQALIVPGGELVSLEELVGQSGLRRNLRLAAEQPPEGLDLRVETGVVPNGAGSLLGGLMKAISLPTMHGDHEYRVSKIIIHTGGHYFAYVRNPDDPDQWLEVNDSRVVPVSTEMVLNDAASRAYLIRISLA